MTRRVGLAVGSGVILAALLEAAVGVHAWKGRGATPPPIRANAAPPSTPVTPAVRPWVPPVGDVEDVLGDGTTESPAGLPKAAVDTQVGTTPTGMPLYEGPNGGVYHLSKGGRKVYHSDQRSDH